MLIETEGIVLRQIKTSGGRRMIVILTEKYGKISAGTSISEKTKSKAALALRPFTLSRFEIFKNGNSYNIGSGEVLKSFFAIGENIDKYMLCGNILELTDKTLNEGQKQRDIFKLLVSFMSEMVERKESLETLAIAYKVKMIKTLGYMPNLSQCVKCEKEKQAGAFSVKEGAYICVDCIQNINGQVDKSSLIFMINFDIVGIILFFERKPLSAFKNLKLEKNITDILDEILKEYYRYHLGVSKLKSDAMRI